MRNLFCLALLLSVSVHVFSQQDTSQPSLLKEQYLQKSKSKKRTGWILLATGVAMMGTGITIAATGGRELYDLDKQISGGLLIIGGAGLSLASAFVFKASQKYKQKAATVSLHMEKTIQPYPQGFVQTFFPILGLIITF